MLTLDNPTLESRLRDRAERDGVPFDELAADAFARGLDALESEAAQDAEDARRILAETRPEDYLAWENVKAEMQADRESNREAV